MILPCNERMLEISPGLEDPEQAMGSMMAPNLWISRLLRRAPANERPSPSSFVLASGRSPYHRDLLVRAPGPRLRHAGLVRPLYAYFSLLASDRRIWTADHFPFAGLITESVSDFELHRQNTNGARWIGRRHPG